MIRTDNPHGTAERMGDDRRRMVGWLAMALAGVIVAGCCGEPVAEGCRIELSSPADGSTVDMEATVAGTVTPPEQQVYVLVHPVEAGQWWVQRLPTADRSGAFKTLAFFGTKVRGLGEDFEILALATCRRLEDGQTLEAGDLPTDGARSQILTVRRGR